MDNDKIKSAFIAYRLAIETSIGLSWPGKESIDDLAKSFGRDITDEESLEFVHNWFDWDNICRFLERK